MFWVAETCTSNPKNLGHMRSKRVGGKRLTQGMYLFQHMNQRKSPVMFELFFRLLKKHWLENYTHAEHCLISSPISDPPPSGIFQARPGLIFTSPRRRLVRPRPPASAPHHPVPSRPSQWERPRFQQSGNSWTWSNWFRLKADSCLQS